MAMSSSSYTNADDGRDRRASGPTRIRGPSPGMQRRPRIEVTALPSEWDRPQLRIQRAARAQVAAEGDQLRERAGAEVLRRARRQRLGQRLPSACAGDPAEGEVSAERTRL